MDETPKHTRNWGRIGLLVSLAVNLIVVGALVGAMFSGGGPGHRMKRPPGLKSYIHALPDAEREAYLEKTNETDRLFKRTMRSGAESDGRVLIELRSNTFDGDKMLVALGTRSRGFIDALETYHKALVSVVEDMSPEERAAYADRVEEMLKKKRRRRP